MVYRNNILSKIECLVKLGFRVSYSVVSDGLSLNKQTNSEYNFKYNFIITHYNQYTNELIGTLQNFEVTDIEIGYCQCVDFIIDNFFDLIKNETLFLSYYKALVYNFNTLIETGSIEIDSYEDEILLDSFLSLKDIYAEVSYEFDHCEFSYFG